MNGVGTRSFVFVLALGSVLFGWVVLVAVKGMSLKLVVVQVCGLFCCCGFLQLVWFFGNWRLSGLLWVLSCSVPSFVTGLAVLVLRAALFWCCLLGGRHVLEFMLLLDLHFDS